MIRIHDLSLTPDQDMQTAPISSVHQAVSLSARSA